MRIIPLIITLLVASPIFGQSRIYTNADLGKPLSRTSTVTPAEAAAILAPRQFVYVPERLPPMVTLSPSGPTTGPFGEFAPFPPPRRLDGSLWTDPPWVSAAFLPPYYYGAVVFPPFIGQPHYSLRDGGRGMRAGGHLLPPKGQPGSMTTRTIRSPQPEWRTTPAPPSGASWPGRDGRPHRD